MHSCQDSRHLVRVLSASWGSADMMKQPHTEPDFLTDGAPPRFPSVTGGPWGFLRPQQGLWMVSALGTSGPQFPHQADLGGRRVIHSGARGYLGCCRVSAAVGGYLPWGQRAHFPSQVHAEFS